MVTIANATVLSITIIAVIILAFPRLVSRDDSAKKDANFWATESKSNETRKQDISNLEYITLELDRLNLEIAEKNGLQREVNELRTLQDKKIINLSAYTNTDLKLMYGPANLETLSEYDDNYATLIKLLNKIGSKLDEQNLTEFATIYYEYAINIGSDITNTYVALANIYKDKANEKGIANLLDKAENLTSISKPIIITKLNNIKS